MKKRKETEKLILSVISVLDKTGMNSDKLKAQFKMTDKEFDNYMVALRDNKSFIRLEVLPYKNFPTLPDVRKAAALIDVPLEDYIYFRHLQKGTLVRSKNKVPVGYMITQRLQQIVRKKTSHSTEISSRSQVTGQLSGSSAIGRITDEECYALLSVGADNILKEFMGPRSDNNKKRLKLYQNIQYGNTSYKDLPEDIREQKTLVYTDVIITSAGMFSNIVSDTELKLKHQ